MGYQETLIYTSKGNIKMNHEHIEEILKMFQRHNICCANDDIVCCVGRLHFNEAVGEFKKGMEMLYICGDRSAQRSPERLFECVSYLTLKEQETIGKIHIDFIEDCANVLNAIKKGSITMERLNLHPDE